MSAATAWPIQAFTESVESDVIVVLSTAAASADAGNGIINNLIVPGYMIMQQHVARLFFCPVEGHTYGNPFLPIPAAVAYLDWPVLDYSAGALRLIEHTQTSVRHFFDLYPDLRG